MSKPPTRTLLIWPEPIENFTRSDAYQQVPRALVARSRTTLLSGTRGAPPDDLAAQFEELLAVAPGRRQFIRQGIARARKAHRRAPFDRIVSAFDVRSLATASRLAAKTNVPWFAVCEDYPFGERYRDADRRPALRMARALHTHLTRRWLARAERIVTFINAGVLDFLELPAGRIAALSNAADMERLEPFRKPADAADPPRLGYVGYVAKDKGALEMAYALAAVRDSVPEATLTLVGETLGGAEFDMRAICPEGLEFLGARDADDSMREMARCAVCLHAYQPHPWLSHNQVLKICEYMALGRPVVSVETPGTRDLLTNGAQGFLVPPGGTVEETGRALGWRAAELLRDPALRQQMGAAGIERTQRELNWQFMAESFARAVGL